MIVKMWVNESLIYCFSEYLENSLVVSYKITHSLTTWPRNRTPKYFPPKNKNLRSHKNLYMLVYSGFRHNNPKLETTQCATTGEWTNWRIHTMEMLLINKKEQITDWFIRDKSQMHFNKGKKTSLKRLQTILFHIQDIQGKATQTRKYISSWGYSKMLIIRGH